MAQPKKTTRSAQQTRRGSRPAKAGARGGSAGSARRQAQTRRATPASERSVEAAAQRIRDINERIIDATKGAGRTTLDVYESTLRAMADSLEKGPGSSDIDWVAQIATVQANFIRDVAKAWASAAREVVK